MRLKILFLFFALPLIAHSQYSETIRTGRPGAAMGAFTVGHKVFQIQTGANFGRMAWGADQKIPTAHTIVVLRYGILERLEVSGLIAYSKNGLSDLENFELDQQGVSAAQIGFRVNIRDGQGSGPNIGFQSRLKLNILSEDFDQARLATVSMLAVTQKLGNKVGLAANLGISWTGGEEDDPFGLYALNFSMPINRKVSVFIENFGVIRDQFETRFDTGLGYLINNNFQLDTSIGYGNNHGVEDMFVDFGFSWRTVGQR